MTGQIHLLASAYTRYIALIGMLIILLWVGIGYNLWHEHVMAEHTATNDSANLTRAFVENISRIIEAVDMTLVFMRDAYKHDPTGFAAGSFTNGPPFMDAAPIHMLLTDRDGNVVWSNVRSNVSGLNLADRAHFQRQRASHDDSLLISDPVVTRMGRTWSILMSRKLLAPDGSFAGVVVVSLDPHYLTRFYQSISIGRGSILLGTMSGTILARVPGDDDAIGTEMPPGIMARIRNNAIGESFRKSSAFDQVERIFSSRRLQRYPLVVVVGLAVDDIFASYNRNMRLYLPVGLMLSVASIVVGMVLARQRQSLLDSQQALTVTLENTSQGIVLIDPAGDVRVLNQRAIDLLGLPPDLAAALPVKRQIVDRQLALQQFGDKPVSDKLHANETDGQDGPPTVAASYEQTRPDGRILKVRTHTLLDGGAVVTFSDITARKRNETALAAAQARAAHAERIQVLGQLAGGIAHDFNNILQAVQGGADLIERRASDPGSVHQFARMILDATERGISITGRLLAFARRGEVVAEPIEVAALLDGLRQLLSHTLGSPIKVEVRLHGTPLLLLADKAQLETVLLNLATNARDAMPQGGTLTFSASCEVVETPADTAAAIPLGRYVRLSIADTGCGMDEATLATAQEPFFSTKPPGQGTGLGLSMAKGFLEQSGGALSIDSVPGHGTMVHLLLPAAPGATSPDPLFLDAPRQHEKAGTHVLLVDDEAMIRETLAAALADLGYVVRSVASGAEALDILTTGQAIDVLVTDLGMPVLDGLALIREARRYCPDLPVLLLTGYAGSGGQLATRDLADSTFSIVRKPVTAAQLADQIEALRSVTVAD